MTEERLLHMTLTKGCLQNTRKRANSECNENKKKKIRLEEGVHSINTTCYATSSKTIKPGKKKKSQSEPPSFKKKCVTPEIKKYASGNLPTSTVSGSSLKDKNFRNRRTSSSASTASRSYSSSTPFSSSIYPSVVGVDRQRTNSVGRSLQKFNPFRGASAPVLSSASLQGSTPTVRYIGPPNQVVRSGIQQMPAPPSASGSGTNGRNCSSATASGDQAGPR